MYRYLHCLLALVLSVVALAGQTIYRFSDPNRTGEFELSPNEMYVSFAARPNPAASARLAGVKGVARVQPLGSGAALVTGEKGRPALLAGIHTPPGSSVAPVFYDRSELPPAERLARMTPEAREKRLAAARRILTGKLLVKIGNEAEWESLAATQPTAREASAIPGWSIVSYADANAALAALEALTRAGKQDFAPVFARQQFRKQALQRSVNDPLYEKQWHLATTGVNLRLRNAWDSVTGKGINIAVVDDGLYVSHEDLSANVWPIDGNYHRNFNEGPANDPTPLDPKDSHGTACAGLVAAVGFNNLGVIGVAPEARLMGLRLIAGPSDDEATAKALLWQPEGVTTHVSSNSWGPADDGEDTGRMGPLQAAALEKGATDGRGGLGVVYVISAGNGREEGDDSSYDEFSGSRFAIAVGAVNKKGEQSSYSESGMNVAISALGGESAPPEMIWTTNNMGPEALAILKEEQETSTAPLNYTDGFNGTSAAAPQVSGAVALLLERNPKLGYRDVKEILIRSAQVEGLKGEEFRANGAGIPFSHSFGAGLLNVAGAVEMASKWTNLGPLQSVSLTSEEELEIPDGVLAGATYPFEFATALRVEHVELVVSVEHPMRGDVGFTITSPSGMVSIAQPRPADEGKNFVRYRFTSARHWGESSTGTWRVKVIDTEKGDVGFVNRVTLRLFGTAK